MIKSTKICTNCKNDRLLSDFYKTKKTKSGLRSECKFCEKEYYILNIQKKLEYGKEYSKIYCKTEKGIAKSKNDGAKRRGNFKKGNVTSEEMINLQKNAITCYWCNIKLHNKVKHIDHYIPISKGGKHTLSNLVVSCANCNLKKSAKDPILFANSIGKLL